MFLTLDTVNQNLTLIIKPAAKQYQLHLSKLTAKSNLQYQKDFFEKIIMFSRYMLLISNKRFILKFFSYYSHLSQTQLTLTKKTKSRVLHSSTLKCTYQ